MFDDDKALIRVDMSEYMEKHSVSKLIGAPAGYVGYDEGGTFTEMIRHRPYSVILLDEIEKAHPEVFNLMLQVLDNGHLTDSKGRKVNFKNTVIIMTSNLGANYIDKMQRFGFSSSDTEKENKDYEDVKNRVMDSLKDFFRPEFLNRIDDIVVFDILSQDAIKQIVDIQVNQVKERLSSKEITLEISPDVSEYLAKEGYNPQYGARPLKRLIQNKILNPIASMIISKGIMKGGVINVGLKDNQFTFDVKKGKKGSLLREELISTEN
jgi:ATP-dependent Clp protease ATP-binding subunit ClpC